MRIYHGTRLSIEIQGRVQAYLAGCAAFDAAHTFGALADLPPIRYLRHDRHPFLRIDIGDFKKAQVPHTLRLHICEEEA